jgi:argininosuccinate lyase
MEIWSSHEHGMFKVPGAWSGVSSFMPQKAHTGTFEHLRTKAGHVVGNMTALVTTFKGEPLQDMLPIIGSASNFAIPGACQAESDLRFFFLLLKNYLPDTERMKENLLTEFSGSPDLQARLVREKGYGLRRAHKIVATMVRLARDRQILPKGLTSELLDEAARMCGEPEPGLETEKIVEDMTFVSFLEKHCNTGDPCPVEGKRMIADRRKTLAGFEAEQQTRRQAVDNSKEKLRKAIEDILSE